LSLRQSVSETEGNTVPIPSKSMSLQTSASENFGRPPSIPMSGKSDGEGSTLPSTYFESTASDELGVSLRESV